MAATSCFLAISTPLLFLLPLGVPWCSTCAWLSDFISAGVYSFAGQSYDMWFQALNNASRNDKTNALLDRTHRLHQDHASIIVAKVVYSCVFLCVFRSVSRTQKPVFVFKYVGQ